MSFLGNAMAPIALAFAVLDLTVSPAHRHGNPVDLGYVLAARSAPQLVFILIGGIIADRLKRNHVMVASSLLSGASQGTLAVLLLTHHARLWEFFVIAAVNGTSSAFFFPASAGIVPQTVPPHFLQHANALLRLALNSSNAAGWAIGGVIVGTAGPGWAIAIDALTFAAGAIFAAAMRLPEIDRLVTPNFVRELAEGWGAFRARRWLWAIVLQFSFLNAAFAGVVQVIGPAQAKAHLGGAWVWGLLFACQVVGLICGGVLMLHIRPQRMLLLATFAIFALAPPLALLGPPAHAALIAIALFVSGIGLEIFAVCWDTTMQEQIPGDMLSRVYSYDMLGSIALVPLGFAVVGPLASVIGTRATVYGAALLIVAVTLPVFLVRDVRELRRR